MPEVIEVPYTDADVPEFAQCAPAAIRIIHIGAGAAGMLFAHKIRRWLKNYELVIYEKNSVSGGTWYENRYPGCACDVASHSYTFTFEPKPDWSGFYSYAPEIENYFAEMAKKWKVDEFVKYNTEVRSATWDDEAGMWEVSLKTTEGLEFTDKAHVIVNGSGVVNKWKWPQAVGLHDFKGTLVHSAAWDETLDWAGKRVAVIGSGSSSIQMVPPLQKTASHLTIFIRNQTWVSPMAGMRISNKEADPEAQDPAGAAFHKYTAKEITKFREDPEYHLKYRRRLEAMACGGFKTFIRGSEINEWNKVKWRETMTEKLRSNEELAKFLIPDWSPGCRRMSPGDGYLEALVSDNVTVVTKDIVRVTSEGIVSIDGAEHKVDIIACATGFHVQYLPHFTITGKDGVVMQDQKTPNVYASIACPGFPNYFVVNGPRGNWGQGCALPSHETQIEYILQCCKKMQEDHIKSMEPKQRLTTQLNLYMDAWHRKYSIWAENCRSWYKDNKPDGRVFIWPGSPMHHLKYMKRPRFEHFNIEYKDDGNSFAFLGNGFTLTDEKYGFDVPVPWIRNNEDEEWEIE